MQVELVERAMNGDRDAFSELAAQSVDRCYGLAYRILRDGELARDATQQALFGAWRDLPGLKEPARFDAWLRRLVVHACYGESRSRRRWSAKVRLLSTMPSASGSDVAHDFARREELESAFRLLPVERRAVVVLHHYLGYPLTEIAGTLGIPVGTARSRLHYAVRQLRAALDEDRPSLAASEERRA